MHLNTPHKLLKERDKERFVTRGVYLILRQCLGGWCLSRTRCFSTRRFDYRYSLHPPVVLLLRLIGGRVPVHGQLGDQCDISVVFSGRVLVLQEVKVHSVDGESLPTEVVTLIVLVQLLQSCL